MATLFFKGGKKHLKYWLYLYFYFFTYQLIICKFEPKKKVKNKKKP